LKVIGRLLPVTARAATGALALAATLAVLAPAGAAAAAPRDAGVAPQKPAPKPQLILIHGGSFLFHDPFFRPLTRPWAKEMGFVPHYVDYPLGDLPSAVTAAREEARKLRQEVGVDRVFAYGASAGGTLAAILAGEGDVSAAVAKAPISDLATWEWPLGRYGTDYYETIVATPEARLRLSPINRPAQEPLLVIQGRGDDVVPPSMNEAFAAKFPRVHLWLVPGGHTTERYRPRIIADAMKWLAQQATRQAEESEAAEALP
jgi:pimeloyl-ACP methyl ester carboxylesterase